MCVFVCMGAVGGIVFTRCFDKSPHFCQEGKEVFVVKELGKGQVLSDKTVCSLLNAVTSELQDGARILLRLKCSP